MKTLNLIRNITLTAVVAIVASATALAQQITLTGRVTYQADGSPIFGVSVVIEGANVGTMTDFQGYYTIKVKEGDKVTFSYIGCQSQTHTVTTATTLNVALEDDGATLNEVVVISYGSRKKPSRNDAASAKIVQERPQADALKIVSENRSDNNIQFPDFDEDSVNDALSVAYEECEEDHAFCIVQTRPQPQYDPNSEEYGKYQENRFKSAMESPLSTFSLDVDGASYTNMRRMINQGQLPYKDAVRIEEYINYFSYNYEAPTGTDPVKINTSVMSCPWNSEHQLVRIGVKAREVASKNLPNSNFVFLIDVSGSMYGPTRLDLVKASMKLLVNNLRDQDRVSIVVYAGAAGLALPSTSGSDKQKIREALDNLTAGGSTAGGAGLKLAYEVARKNFVKDGNNRIILCTDGDFNVGQTSDDAMLSLVETERKSGVFLTVLGYGMGNYKDKKMQTLAQNGNGNAAYIDNLQEANKVLINEFGATMYTVAKDVKLQVEFNPTLVQAYRLVGYESRLLNNEDFNDDTKDAGELGAGHTVTALYEVVPVGVKGNYAGKVDDLRYQTPKKVETKASGNTSEMMFVKLRYKQPDGDVSTKMEVPVKRATVFNTSSADDNFIAAVAMYAHLLRDSDFKGTSSYDKILELARKGLGDDKNGYRREFVRLVETAKQLDKSF